MLLALLDADGRTWADRIRWRVGAKVGTDLTAANRAIHQWLRSHEVPALAVALQRGGVERGQLVWTEMAFHWSDVAAERRALWAGAEVRCSFHSAVEVTGSEGRHVEIEGTFNPRYVTCSTANVELRGVRSQYVMGYVADSTPDAVELRPIAIGERLLRPPSTWSAPAVYWQAVHPRQVDQFANVDWGQPVSTADLDSLRAVPEREVKHAIARLLGEPVVPKDWGGEQADLWTAGLLIDGEQHSAAFLLKGPARFRPMTIGMLGKDGDQINRLARLPAQVLVVQHCHQVGPDVVQMLHAYASDYRNVRRYMVIDGYDTYRLLIHAGIVKR